MAPKRQPKVPAKIRKLWRYRPCRYHNMYQQGLKLHFREQATKNKVLHAWPVPTNMATSAEEAKFARYLKTLGIQAERSNKL